jgi:hypothetical protein
MDLDAFPIPLMHNLTQKIVGNRFSPKLTWKLLTTRFHWLSLTDCTLLSRLTGICTRLSNCLFIWQTWLLCFNEWWMIWFVTMVYFIPMFTSTMLSSVAKIMIKIWIIFWLLQQPCSLCLMRQNAPSHTVSFIFNQAGKGKRQETANYPIGIGYRTIHVHLWSKV